MADNLIFPIKFDLEKGVIEAGKDADKYLRQLENTLRQKPIKLDVAIDGAVPGSIDAISKRMSALSQEFNKLTEAQRVYNRTSGEFTPEAQKIIKEYAELTAATHTYAQSLSQITAAAKRQTQEQIKEQEQEIKRYEEYWKRKETDNAKQAQQDIANAERARKAQQQRISQEQAEDAKRYQEWLRQKNQEAVETERVERQKQRSIERTIAQQNREFEAQRQSELKRQQDISASLRAEYQRIEAKKQAEAASRRELQLLNQQYAAEERRQRLAASQASIAKRQQVIKTLRAEENTIVNITAKLQHWQQVMNSSAMDGRQFRRAAAEVQRLSQKLSEAQARISQLTATTSNASARQTAAVKQVSNEFKNQETYVSRLLKRMAVYASFSAISNFLTNVREVTAQFELQRISLGAIIQDQQRANQLFSEIKSFALTSPLKILDLTKYTKQVAAYGIETEKLFDTTKRLADVSVGLGVDMGRLVLAYGQVKAASYLRAAEIRQFTEAGIPMLDLLAKKFTDLQGKMVSTEQVMDLVSKRAVSFSMVEDIFNDMTSAGGMFYNMQEKQSQTLFGMWSKLGDAAAMMYDEIGNTEGVNAGMKMTIGLLESAMRNWRYLANEITAAAIAFGVFKTVSTAIKWMQVNTVAAAAAERQLAAATLKKNNAIASGSTIMKLSAARLSAIASWNLKAATSTNLLTVAWNKLKVAMATWGPMLIITALTTIVSWFISARQEANRLNKELSKMSAEGAANADAMVRNFERLANAVVESADGSKKQHEALEELKRTYSDIIPAQNLTIEKLRAMKGAYEDVAKAIREKVYQQNLERQISTIQEEYGGKISKGEKKTKELLASYGLDSNEIGRVMGAIDEAINDGLITAEDDIKTRMAVIGKIVQDQTGKTIDFMEAITATNKAGGKYIMGYRISNEFTKLSNAITNASIATTEMNAKIKKQEEFMEGLTGKLGEYTNEWKRVQKEIADNKIIAGPEDSQFLVSKQNDNKAIQSWAASLKNVLGDAWDEAFVSLEESVGEKGDKMSYILFDKLMAPEVFEKFSIQQQNYIKQIQDEYYNLIPKEAVVRSVNDRFTRLANSLGLIDKVRGDMMGASEDLEAYRKKINDTAKDYATQVENLTRVLAMTPMVLKDYAEISDKLKDTKALEKFYTTWAKMLGESKKGGGRASDPRLQTLQEIANKMAEVNREYDELLKKEGQTKALADTQKLFASSFEQMEATAKKYGFKLPAFEVPQTIEEVQKWYKAISDEIKRLGLKNADKVLIELGFKSDKAAIDKQQKEIEKQIKVLADRISRTKTAKEFYDKVLGMTGDYQLSANLAVSVYGQNGRDLQDAIREQIRTAFETDPEKNVTIDLSEAIDPDTGAINYNKLAELEETYKDVLIKGRADLRKKLIDEGRKTSEAQVQQWLKDIEKAKDFAQQRIDLATYTANQIAAINAREDLPQADKDKLIKGYQDREAKQLAKLQYEEFKDSAMYVHIFEDLDHASTTALKNMRDRLVALKGQWQNLDPTQVKELTKAIADLNERIAGRSPFKSIIDGFKGLAAARPQKVIDAEMIAATDELAKREEALTAATQRLTEAQTAQVNAQAEVAQARQDLEDALAVSGGKETAEVKAAREVLGIKIATFNAVKAASKDSISAAKKEVDKAADKYEEQKKVIDKLVEEGKLREANIKKIELANQKIDEYQQQINEALDGIRKMMEAFGASDEDMQFFDDVVGSLNEIVDAGQQAAMSVASFMSGNILGGITSGVSAIGGLVSGFTNLFSAGKVRRANKEIKRQQELLDQLEYTYGRLEYAADKLFGRDYLNNYNQQLKNLQAQQTAYQKQADAERSKGKKADEEKIKEYENQARETADKIKELQDDLVSQIVGTDVASAARDFANAWLDAYLSFGSTTDAIKEKFDDMIKNMIVNMVLAQVVKRALQPIFDMIDELAKDGELSASDIAKVFAMVPQSMQDINNGLSVGMEALKAAGVDISKLREGSGEYTGIAKSVAGATSEEINNVAAIGNTLMYYVSPIPRIDENLARVVALMEGRGASAIPQTTSAGWTDWQQQAMDNYQAIARNTAETVAQCRRSAAACEAFAADIHRMIEVSGGKHRLNVKL